MFKEFTVTLSVLIESERGTAVPVRSMLERANVKHACVATNRTRLPQTCLGLMAKPLKQNHAYMELDRPTKTDSSSVVLSTQVLKRDYFVHVCVCLAMIVIHVDD